MRVRSASHPLLARDSDSLRLARAIMSPSPIFSSLQQRPSGEREACCKAHALDGHQVEASDRQAAPAAG